MDKAKIEILIEAYVEKTISKEDKIELMAIVKQNPDLLNEIESRIDILQSLKYIGNDELKTRLAKIHMLENQQLESTSKPKLFRWVILSLALAAFVAVSLFIYNNYFKTVSSDQVYASFYKPYDASFSSRNNEVINFSELKSAYDVQNYEEVIDLVSTKMSTEIKDSELLLAIGISAMELGEQDLSRSYFNEIINRSDFFYLDHARWYSALSYIKDGDNAAAVALLNSIRSNPKANHYKEANQLLEKIK